MIIRNNWISWLSGFGFYDNLWEKIFLLSCTCEGLVIRGLIKLDGRWLRTEVSLGSDHTQYSYHGYKSDREHMLCWKASCDLESAAFSCTIESFYRRVPLLRRLLPLFPSQRFMIVLLLSDRFWGINGLPEWLWDTCFLVKIKLRN